MMNTMFVFVLSFIAGATLPILGAVAMRMLCAKDVRRIEKKIQEVLQSTWISRNAAHRDSDRHDRQIGRLNEAVEFLGSELGKKANKKRKG